jgi:HEAT repeat protein
MAGLALAFGASNKTDILPTLPALTRLLSDSEPKVRRGASTAFALIARSGIDVAQALPALRALLEDPDAGVRTQAAKAVEDASRQPR